MHWDLSRSSTSHRIYSDAPSLTILSTRFYTPLLQSCKWRLTKLRTRLRASLQPKIVDSIVNTPNQSTIPSRGCSCTDATNILLASVEQMRMAMGDPTQPVVRQRRGIAKPTGWWRRSAYVQTATTWPPHPTLIAAWWRPSLTGDATARSASAWLAEEVPAFACR